MGRFMLFAALLLTATHAAAETHYFRGYPFEAFVETADYPCRGLCGRHGQTGRVVAAYEGQEYSIVVRNPLPVRAAVLVTVDGLNTIDGTSSTADRGAKWMIEPYGTIQIDGWQTGDSRLRKFIFTRPQSSYAAWREYRDGRHYTHKLGEIRVAFFWSSHELHDALHRRGPYWYERKYSPNQSLESGADARSGAAPWYDPRAGTGMGRYESNPVEMVNYYYDTGMYSERDSLIIYYSFSHEPYWEAPIYPRPLPQRRYAPEMP